MTASISARGRVNLIGDHTDYTGGYVMPMVLDVATTITGDYTNEPTWRLISADDPQPALIARPVGEPSTHEPRWSRYVAGVLAEFEGAGLSVPGFDGRVETTIPIGSGLSSSAALEVAVARLAARDTRIDDLELARLCRRAEHRASGVPCGIMDQLCIAAGRPGHAALIDCRSLDVRHIGLPAGLEVVVEFVAARSLVGTEYSDRVAQTARVEEIIGPLRDATEADLTRIDDDLLRRRARHVITENQRVLEFAAALEADERGELGRLMNESHRSLSEDFETSNPTMDAAVRRLREDPAVHGARITGGGFGGCVVALRSQSRRRRFWRSNSSSVIVPRSRSASHFSN